MIVKPNYVERTLCILYILHTTDSYHTQSASLYWTAIHLSICVMGVETNRQHDLFPALILVVCKCIKTG